MIDSLHRAAFGLTPSDQPQKIPALADSRGEMDAVRLLRQMGVTPEALEQVQGAAAGKPITTAEAIGPDGMELAQGLRGRAGTTNAIASAALDQRAGLRPDRVLMDASQVAEAHPSAVMGDPYELFKASRERGAPYMEEARRLPPPLDFPLANLYYSPELNGQELDVRRDVKSRGLKYMERSPAQYYNDRSTAILRGELPNKKMSHAWTPQPNKVMLSIDSYDALKNRLQGLIEGEPEPLNKEQRTMKRIADELHTKLINSFPTGEAYAKAHEYQGDYASNASAWRNAQGRLLDPSVDPLSFDSQFSALMPFERNAAAAAGAGDIANLAYKHPFDAGIVSDPAVFEKMGVLFGKTGAQRLADALTTEGTMADFEKPPPTGRDGLYQRLRAAGQAPLNMAGRNSLGGLLYQDPATTAQIMRSYKPNALDTTRVRLPPFLQYGAPAVVGEFQGLGNGPIPSQP
ncbi:MAG: hypothetical protein JO111_12955 [Caulobacteraceae bacterium]|nr:hypothetical protein [Caulobacteraceae bacterium]